MFAGMSFINYLYSSTGDEVRVFQINNLFIDFFRCDVIHSWCYVIARPATVYKQYTGESVINNVVQL